MADADPLALTTAERALIRVEFMVRFGQEPLLANGIWLRTSRGGPQAGHSHDVAAVSEADVTDQGQRVGERTRTVAAKNASRLIVKSLLVQWA